MVDVLWGINLTCRTLAVPTKAIFYKNPILMTIPSFSYHTSLILQSAPTTTSASFKCLIPQSCQISLFRSWHFSSFHLPFYTVCDPMVKQYPQYFWLMFLPIRSWLFSGLPHITMITTCTLLHSHISSSYFKSSYVGLFSLFFPWF